MAIARWMVVSVVDIGHVTPSLQSAMQVCPSETQTCALPPAIWEVLTRRHNDSLIEPKN